MRTALYWWRATPRDTWRAALAIALHRRAAGRGGAGRAGGRPPDRLRLRPLPGLDRRERRVRQRARRGAGDAADAPDDADLAAARRRRRARRTSGLDAVPVVHGTGRRLLPRPTA